jgi:hypothetical protein
VSAAWVGLSGPTARPKDRADLGGQGTRAQHVRPERPGSQPTRGRATTIPSAVADPCASALVAELAIELDQDALLHVGDVVVLGTSWGAGVLSSTVGQPMGSLDIAEVSHLHGAFGAPGDVPEHLPQQRTTRMPRPFREPDRQRALSGPLSLEGPTQQGEELVDVGDLREIQERVLGVGDPGPPQRVDPGIQVAAATHRRT